MGNWKFSEVEVKSLHTTVFINAKAGVTNLFACVHKCTHMHTHAHINTLSFSSVCVVGILTFLCVFGLSIVLFF